MGSVMQKWLWEGLLSQVIASEFIILCRRSLHLEALWVPGGRKWGLTGGFRWFWARKGHRRGV